MNKKGKEFVIYDLGHGVSLKMPKMVDSHAIIVALLTLGGLFYHGLVETNQERGQFKKMVEECFGYIKNHDFSKLKDEIEMVCIYEEEVNEA